MKIIAVDDEVLQLETVVEYITELYPTAEVMGFNKVSSVLEYAEKEIIDLAILDINMPGNINGINLGMILRQKNKRMKLVYCTGYSDYAIDAFKMHANGYLQKPIRKDELKHELEYALQMPVYKDTDKPHIHTFGNFDIFVKNRPIVFKRSKSKEILAYLADRKGSWITNRELSAVLWEKAEDYVALSKYITTLVRDMILDLENADIGHIIERKRGKIRLLVNEVTCDYFDYLQGDQLAIGQFNNEYMTQYSWAENTLANLWRN